MARILYGHPSRTSGRYHIFTDLDFWDARLILKDMIMPRRNFGSNPNGDEFPTQIIGPELSRAQRKRVEDRLKKAIPSPPRHVIVRSIVAHGIFEFDPSRYVPVHWTLSRILFFITKRLPLNQSALNSPHRTVRVREVDGMIRIERIQRNGKFDPVIKTRKQANAIRFGPSCF
jgi:hypothetical protein